MAQNIVITGASTGIGEACARELARRGLTVFAGVRKESDGERLRAGASDRLQPIILDVTDEASIAAAAKVVSERTGNRLAGLVNNAGIGIGGPLEFVSVDDLRRQFDVNVVGQIAVTQAFLPMIRAAGGRIVFMGSISGKFAVPFAAPYSASKHALEAIADALRIELKPWNIAISIIEPGAVATPIWDKARATVGEVEAGASQDLYGAVLARIRVLIEEEARAGVPPLDVAKLVVHALTASKPHTRYVIGKQAKLRVLLAKILPDGLRDELILRQAKLPR